MQNAKKKKSSHLFSCLPAWKCEANVFKTFGSTEQQIFAGERKLRIAHADCKQNVTFVIFGRFVEMLDSIRARNNTKNEKIGLNKAFTMCTQHAIKESSSYIVS